jgi:hypothetical protein
MYDVKYGGTLVKGDMIAVSTSNCLNIGFYIGLAKSGTVHYYSLEQLKWMYDNWEEQKLNKEEQDIKLRKPPVYYVYPHHLRFMKITRDVLTKPEDLENYEKALIMLKELKIRK